MPGFVTPAIPASQTVAVNPSVLAAGGTALDLIGLELTQSTRPPIGQVLTFVDALDVANYFGPTSVEAAHAAIYFLGPNNATVTPQEMLFAQYPENQVPGYLRGGDVAAMTLAQLQAINATLSVVIDGGSPTSQTISLSAATSFSNAAEIIGATLGIEGPLAANITASLSTTVMTVASVNYGALQGTVTASLSGTVMTVTAVASGVLRVGQVVVGTGIGAGVTIASLGSGTGGIGTYNLSNSVTTETAETINAYAPAPRLALGQVVAGTGITAGTYIASFGTGTGGAGTYNLSQSATTESNESISVYSPGVYFDSQLDAFVISSGTTGTSSSVAFATGAAATSLLLTQATGAVQSPGSNATDPITFMDGIIAITQDWLSFMTAWEAADAEKENFATWTNSQNNLYRYCMQDTNVANTAAGGPSAPVAFINNGTNGYLNSNGLSGTVMIHENPAVDLVGGELAAFAMSWAASLDFTRHNGRQTEKFKSQSGLAAQVFNGSIANYLTGYGLNFYGDNTTANESFVYFAQGSISGPFLWDDSYTNQVWLNNQLQLAIMVGLVNTPSIPYNLDGDALVESFCLDPINEAVNFGAIVAGVTLSAAQIVEVNNAAGVDIDQTLFQRGWYLQILPAIPQVRRARTSPPCTLWYCDGGSIQQITLASIEIQ